MIALAAEFREEETRQVRDAVVVALHADGDLVDLSLDLDHVVENQVHEDHEGVLLHARVLVAKTRGRDETNK